jgi:hypothetical protein
MIDQDNQNKSHLHQLSRSPSMLQYRIITINNEKKSNQSSPNDHNPTFNKVKINRMQARS